MSARPDSWRTCSYCGETAPPGGSPCPTCGHDVSVGRGEAARLPKRLGQRFRFVQAVRVVIVVTAVVGVSYAIVNAVMTGPTTFADPLTFSGTYTISAGNYTVFNGNITGEDYVEGNYSVVAPYATDVTLQVYNSSEYASFQGAGSNSSLDAVASLSSGRIVFAAPYTDMFYFVFSNPYPAASGIAIHLYVTMTYESNVVLG